MATVYETHPSDRQRPPTRDELLFEELRAIRQEQAAFRRLFDEFAGVFLNAKFPYGQPRDRWARR
jgi:hypothetical protein